MIEYSSASIYLRSAKDANEEIARINTLIRALEDLQIDSVSKANITEYWLDDGQIKIKTAYRSNNEIEDTIFKLEQRKQRAINDINGRKFTLVDGKNFIGRGYYGRR